MKRYLLGPDGQPKKTLCGRMKGFSHCGEMTLSILSEDGTHYNCEKCGEGK